MQANLETNKTLAKEAESCSPPSVPQVDAEAAITEATLRAKNSKRGVSLVSLDRVDSDRKAFGHVDADGDRQLTLAEALKHGGDVETCDRNL